MRYSDSEKLGIIRLVARSHLPERRILEMLGVPPTTVYQKYDRYRAFGEVGARGSQQLSRPGLEPHPGQCLPPDRGP